MVLLCETVSHARIFMLVDCKAKIIPPVSHWKLESISKITTSYYFLSASNKSNPAGETLENRIMDSYVNVDIRYWCIHKRHSFGTLSFIPFSPYSFRHSCDLQRTLLNSHFLPEPFSKAFLCKEKSFRTQLRKYFYYESPF